MSSEPGTKRLRTGDVTTVVSRARTAAVASLLGDSKEEKDILRRVNSFLDAWSLFQWGRVVVRMRGCRAAAHEIGLALMDPLIQQGYVRMDIIAIFLDQEEGSEHVVEEAKTEEEIKYFSECARAKEEGSRRRNHRSEFRSIQWPKVPESLEKIEPQSLAWKRRFDFVCEAPPDYAGYRYCPASAWFFLDGCWEDVLPNLSLPQRHLVYCFVREFVEAGLKESPNCPGIVTMDGLYLVGKSNENKDIFFSKPLETQYAMGLGYTYCSCKLTLRDLASLNTNWSHHRLEEEDPDYTNHQLYEFAEKYVDKFSHEELVQDVEQRLAKDLGQTVESVRNEGIATTDGSDEINSQGSKDDQEDWEAWKRAHDELYDMDEEKAQIDSQKRFLIEQPYSSQPPRRGKPKLSTSRTAFARALATFPTGCLKKYIHLSVSALDLAQMIMEDFVSGVAVKPFLVAREGKMPTWCRLIIGKHHGTTMAAFQSVLQFPENALEEGSDEDDSDYCPSDVDSASSEEEEAKVPSATTDAEGS